MRQKQIKGNSGSNWWAAQALAEPVDPDSATHQQPEFPFSSTKIAKSVSHCNRFERGVTVEGQTNYVSSSESEPPVAADAVAVGATLWSRIPDPVIAARGPLPPMAIGSSVATGHKKSGSRRSRSFQLAAWLRIYSSTIRRVGSPSRVQLTTRSSMPRSAAS